MTILGQSAHTIALTTTAAGSRGADGRYVAGASATVSIAGSVQPAPEEVLQRLPAGLRSSDVRVLLTTTAITLAPQHEGTLPPTVTADGIDFEVQSVRKVPAVIPHYEVILLRVAEEDSE